MRACLDVEECEGGERECVRGRGGKYYAICVCVCVFGEGGELCECVRGRGVNIMQFVCVQCFGNVRFVSVCGGGG